MKDQVLIVGSGPAGLAVAAELGARGISATVLERGDEVATAWAGRYDSLRFNTNRWTSALPGEPFPRAWGQFPTRDQYVGYLRGHAERHRVRVRTGIDVERLDPDARGWRLTTTNGPWYAPHVVVATGICNRPVLPDWAADVPAGAPRVLHSADYRTPAPFIGQDVVVVGAGSTGMEVAHEVAAAGARAVHLAYRTPPNVLLRTFGGLPTDLPVPLFLHLPPRLVDAMFGVMRRRMVGDLSPYGLPDPPEGPMAALERGSGTAIIDREVVEALRAGRFRVVPEVAGLHEGGVDLVDGRRVPADVVVAATGFGTGLSRMLGHLDVLDDRELPLVRNGGEALPGLRFAGYVFRPGLTGYVGRQARWIARALAARERAARRARGGSRSPASRTPTSRDPAGSRR